MVIYMEGVCVWSIWHYLAVPYDLLVEIGTLLGRGGCQDLGHVNLALAFNLAPLPLQNLTTWHLNIDFIKAKCFALCLCAHWRKLSLRCPAALASWNHQLDLAAMLQLVVECVCSALSCSAIRSGCGDWDTPGQGRSSRSWPCQSGLDVESCPPAIAEFDDLACKHRFCTKAECCAP